MNFFSRFPYTNFHELNLDWLVDEMKKLSSTVENFIAFNTIKYADPFQWNITRQYEANTVTIDANSGIAYISVKAVPAGVAITNTSYWSPVFDLSQLFVDFNGNLTFNDEAQNVVSSANYSVDDWLIWNNELYVVTMAINAGDALVDGYNLSRKSIEELFDDLFTYFNSQITAINNEMFKNAVDIRTLGAVAGSDIASIVADAFNDYDIVIIPAGTWAVSQIELVSHKKLIGFDATLKALDNNNQPLMIGDGIEDVYIEGLSFDMNTGNNTTATRVFYVHDGDSVEVKNCKFESAVLDGGAANGTMFVCMEDSQNCSFIGCVASNSNDEGLGFLTSTHCTIDNCVGTNNPYGSIFLLNGCTYSTIKNCDASDSWGSCIGVNSSYCSCLDNFVHDADSANFGIVMGHDATGLKSDFSICKGNVLKHIASGICTMGSVHVVIADNTIHNDGIKYNTRTSDPAVGISVADGGSRCEIVGNTINGPYNGIVITTLNRVSNCLVWSVTGDAISIYGNYNQLSCCELSAGAVGVHVPNDNVIDNIISSFFISSMTSDSVYVDYAASRAKTYANDCITNKAITTAVADNCHLI